MTPTYLAAALLLLLACDREPASPASSPRSAPAVATPTMSDAASTPATPEPVASTVASADASTPAPLTPLAPPVKVTRSGKVWPFHAWNRAEAITFNHFPMRAGVPTRVYDDVKGWSPHVVDRRPLDAAQGAKAVSFVGQTKGEVIVSKCPFPRHAVVLYEDAEPIATINVCFDCGDILVWPSWDPKLDDIAYDALTKKQQNEREAFAAKQLKLYDATFPKWKSYFGDEIGFSVSKFSP